MDDRASGLTHLLYYSSLGLLDHKEKVIADSIDWLTWTMEWTNRGYTVLEQGLNLFNHDCFYEYSFIWIFPYLML